MTTTSVTGLHINLNVLNIHVHSKAMAPPIKIEITTVYRNCQKILKIVNPSIPSLPELYAYI